jgi:archaellum component FlaG (FlaF/FlaG flagellin family)
MISRLVMVIAAALVAAGVIIYTNASDMQPALSMQDGSGHK